MVFRFLCSVILLCFASLAAAANEDAASLLAHAKVMSGGALWDRVVALNGQGQIHAAGLQGTLESHEDLLRGRQVTRYKLGGLDGASGYDGKTAWEQDPGGEVGVLDDTQALREARTAAWLTARAYWYPQRGGATYGAVEQRDIRGRQFRVVTATPTDGEPVELWFNERSGLLDRFVTRVGGKDMQSTRLSEWKNIDGLHLPTSILIERGDDARARVFIHYASYAPGTALSEAEFAAPAISARTHIADPSGTARVPFTLVRDHIHVDAKVDGKPVRMLVDTGGMNILLPKSAQRLGLASSGKLQGRGVGEKSTDVAMAPATTLQLGGVSIDKPVFYVIDFGQLPDVEGEDFDGVIGYELFQRLGVTIDYGAHELLLTAAEKFTPPVKSQAFPFTLSERIPIVQGRIDGLPARISVDTGSGSAIDLHSPFVKRQDLKTRYDAKFEQISGWGVGGPMRAWPVRLGQLQLGDYHLTDVAASLTPATRVRLLAMTWTPIWAAACCRASRSVSTTRTR